MSETPVRFQRVETGEPLSYADRCHNGRQLVVNQLAILRANGGIHDDGQPFWAERELAHVDGDRRVRVTTESMHQATIRVPGSSVSNQPAGHTVYEFDAQGQRLTAQEFTAEGTPLSEPSAFSDDALGDSTLAQLHATLFQMNNTPDAPAV